MRVEDLLASRTDLSTFLVHLTRDTEGQTAKEKLKKILTDQKLVAGKAYGAAVAHLNGGGHNSETQKVVCFTETPMEHLSLLASEIEGRDCKFEPYGVAVTRKQGRKKGINPVWYVDITPGHDWLMEPVNALIQSAIQSGNFNESDISRIAPFIEQMGSGANYHKEFWWEREWRCVGDYSLPPRYIILCPVADILEIKAVVDGLDEAQKPNRVSYIDPRWSLEMIIGKLAGFEGGELGPF